VPFLVFGALAFALHLLPSAEPRMIIPVIPVLVWLIAHALIRPLPCGREQPVTA
jgi:hypothetical protein